MIVLIPLGGIGKRFKDNQYEMPKALIDIEGKAIIFWLLDNLNLNNPDIDYIYIPYNSEYSNFNFEIKIQERYPGTKFKFLKLVSNTDGAAHTVNLALEHILHENDEPIICIDADNFYTTDILSLWNGANKIFTFTDWSQTDNPKYSYVEHLSDNIILNIEEKEKISNKACTGAYGFSSFYELHEYTCFILNNQIKVKNEYYLSTVIQCMIDDKNSFVNETIDNKYFFSLGTPEQVKQFENVYLFDLDGTLVDTDKLYLFIWNEILKKYNIYIDELYFEKNIKGHSDSTFLKSLIPQICIQEIHTISEMKDSLFIKNIDKIHIFADAVHFIQQLQNSRIAIVSNCNQCVANQILDYFNLNQYINVLISASNCNKPKPHAEPYLLAITLLGANIAHKNKKCIVFEDSYTGYTSAKNADIVNIFMKVSKYDKLLSNIKVKKFNEYSELNPYALISDNTNHDIIRKSFKKPIIDIENFETNIKTGGYICNVYSYKIKLKDNITQNIILKLSNLNNPLSETAHKLDLYNNEKMFYDKICSKIDDVIKVPKCHGIFQDEKQIGILMENLSVYKGRFDLDLNNNINIVLHIVNDISKMHLKFYYENNHIFDEVKKINEIYHYKTLIIERYNIFINKTSLFMSHKMQEIMNTIYQKFTLVLDKLSSYPLTLCHGDLKSPNIFYKDYKEPYFLDWQYINLSKGVTDIAFLMCESIDFDIVTSNLIINYYYSLIKAENPLYSHDVFMYELKLALCAFPFVVCVWFNSEDNSILVNKTFPLRFLQNTLKYMDYFLDVEFLQTLS